MFVNGSSTVCRHLEYADAANADIHIITMHKNTNLRQNNFLHSPRVSVYSVASRSYLLQLIKSFVCACRLCSSSKFHLIYTQDPFGTGLIGSVRKFFFSVPLIVGNHSSFANNPFGFENVHCFFVSFEPLCQFLYILLIVLG